MRLSFLAILGVSTCCALLAGAQVKPAVDNKKIAANEVALTFTVSGGITGRTREIRVTSTTDGAQVSEKITPAGAAEPIDPKSLGTLSRGKTQELQNLIKDTPTYIAPSTDGARIADGQRYAIDADSGLKCAWSDGSPDVPARVKKLVEWLNQVQTHLKS
jgi:hypothetical protein